MIEIIPIYSAILLFDVLYYTIVVYCKYIKYIIQKTNIFRKKENKVDLKKDKANGKKKPVNGARELLDTGPSADSSDTGMVQPQIKQPSLYEGSFVIKGSDIPLYRAQMTYKRQQLKLINS